MKRQLILLVVGFLIAAVLLAGCSSQAPAPQGGNSQQSQQGQGTQGAIQIKYAVVGPDDHPYTIMAKKFKELVEAKTNGQLEQLTDKHNHLRRMYLVYPPIIL